MQHLILRFIINAIALFAATQVGIPGLRFDGDWKTIAVVALIFGVVNALVRPLITVLTCPLMMLTLGLFTFVVNALMLALTGWIAGQFHLGFTVDGLWAAFLGDIVISVVSFILTLFIREPAHEHRSMRDARY
ncbi:MAG: phage holin family protein [Acidobacteriota bacterium]